MNLHTVVHVHVSYRMHHAFMYHRGILYNDANSSPPTTARPSSTNKPPHAQALRTPLTLPSPLLRLNRMFLLPPLIFPESLNRSLGVPVCLPQV